MSYLKVAIAILAAGSACSALAQYNYTNTGFYTESSNFNSYMQNVDFNRVTADTIDDGSNEADVKNPSPHEASGSSLFYTPSLSLRRENAARFALSMKKNNPANASHLEASISEGKFVDDMDQIMKPMGLRIDNVADAYALWWVMAWTAANANAVSEVPLQQSIFAVKNQATELLTSAPEFASAPDALKQEIAETMLIQTVVLVNEMELTKNNPVQQDRLAKAVNQSAMQMGLDLTKMDLTERGFASRR